MGSYKWYGNLRYNHHYKIHPFFIYPPSPHSTGKSMLMAQFVIWFTRKPFGRVQMSYVVKYIEVWERTSAISTASTILNLYLQLTIYQCYLHIHTVFQRDGHVLYRSSPVKLKVQLPIIDCSDAYAAYNLGPGQLCAGGERNKDSCFGDSGN